MKEKLFEKIREETKQPEQFSNKVFNEYAQQCKDNPEYCAQGLTHEVCKNLKDADKVKICQCQALKNVREGYLEPDENLECNNAKANLKQKLIRKAEEKQKLSRKIAKNIE